MRRRRFLGTVLAPVVVGAWGDRAALAQASTSKGAGPLIGHVSSDEAHLWAYAGAGARLAVRFNPKGSDAEPTTVPMPTPESHRWAGRTILRGLEPNKRYEYQ